MKNIQTLGSYPRVEKAIEHEGDSDTNGLKRTLNDGISLEPKWQQVSFGVQNFSEYSNRSQQRSGLNDLDFFYDFLFLQSPFQIFEDYTKCANYN